MYKKFVILSVNYRQIWNEDIFCKVVWLKWEKQQYQIHKICTAFHWYVQQTRKMLAPTADVTCGRPVIYHQTSPSSMTYCCLVQCSSFALYGPKSWNIARVTASQKTCGKQGSAVGKRRDRWTRGNNDFSAMTPNPWNPHNTTSQQHLSKVDYL